MFNDKMKSIEVCLARFDEDTKATFLDLYTKVDENVLGQDTIVNEEEDGLEL